jgi:hypothetical protein
MDFDTYFSGMSSVIKAGLDGHKIHRLRIGKLPPAETAKAVVDAVRRILANQDISNR